jgi:hypothetical protein
VNRNTRVFTHAARPEEPSWTVAER